MTEPRLKGAKTSSNTERGLDHCVAKFEGLL